MMGVVAIFVSSFQNWMHFASSTSQHEVEVEMEHGCPSFAFLCITLVSKVIALCHSEVKNLAQNY